jgi:putative CocE/NonD family hydrolase
VPFVNVGGWYDIFSAGTVENFMGLQTQGAGKARGNQKLVMGAFGHGALSGDLKYPPDAADRRLMDPFRWFDFWLKGVQNGADKEPAVRYYMMGDTMEQGSPGNEWRSANAWPPASTITPYYLASGGELTTTPPGASKDTFSYDPRNPVPTIGGNNLTLPKGPMDQRAVGTREDVLRYQTEPLAQAVEIAGNIEAELTVSTDAEDTDFMVKLVDVYPNGYEALVLDQAFRMRYHAGFDKAARVEKGKAYTIKVNLWPTALAFNRGHRIAVHVSSSNAPRFERHTNTWEPLRSYDQAVIARNTVHLGKSRVMLPVTKVYGIGEGR